MCINSSTLFSYQKEYEIVKNSPDYQSKVQALETFMKELAENMGRASPISALDMNHLYHTFAAEKSMNLSLPHWAEGIFPDGKLRDGALLQYLHYGYNEKLKRLSGGKQTLILYRYYRKNANISAVYIK